MKKVKLCFKTIDKCHRLTVIKSYLCSLYIYVHTFSTATKIKTHVGCKIEWRRLHFRYSVKNTCTRTL